MSYSPQYVVPLPPRHSFPMGKFSALHQLMLERNLVSPSQVIAPQPASWETLGLIHTDDYLRPLRLGTMTKQAVRRMGLPWTEALVRRSRVAVTGTINAARFALEDGLAGNLAGGTHHSFPDHAEGFCVLNDVAIAITTLLNEGTINNALVIDLDVHQGNGTASIFEHDPRVFTFSMHGAKNFPMRKENSTRDVPLDDGLSDDQYITILDRELNELFDRFSAQTNSTPDLVFYLGGVDVLADDKFGRMSLSMEGLARRDHIVANAVRTRGIPLCLLLSGGYAPTPRETAIRHVVMYEQAAAVERVLARASTFRPS